MTSPDEDLDLWQRWLNGAQDAGDSLAQRHRATLRGYFSCKCRAQDCGDLEQQVWLELLKSRPVEFQTSFRAYLLGIAYHVLTRYCRRKNLAWDPSIMSLRDLDLSLSQAVILQMGVKHLRARLLLLPFDLQSLVEMRYMQGLSIPDLASMHKKPLGTIKRRLWHARQLLLAELPAAEACLPLR